MIEIAGILAIIGSAFVIAYIGFQIKDENWPLQILCIAFSIFLLVIAPRYVDDHKNNCQNVINQTQQEQTTVLGITETNVSYTYMQFCTNDMANTTDTFYYTNLWFLIIFVTYLVIMFIKHVLIGTEGITKR